MELFDLSPTELFQALFDHGVSVEYSKDEDCLLICPLAGTHAGKCLLPGGLTEVIDATLLTREGGWRVKGVLGSGSGANSESFKEFQLAPYHIPIEFSNEGFMVMFPHGAEPYQQGDEVLIVKNRIYLVSKSSL